MKKQLLRYKLKADQKVGRANKTEVLNDELLQIEKRLERVRVACQSVYKRISQCIQSSGSDLDKRLKKLPETAVANAMLEASNQLSTDPDSALYKSLKVCAEAQTGVAKDRALYEMFIEGHVVTPLQTLVEVDIPNIQKMRERLKRLVLDRDNASQTWSKAYKAQYNPGANIPQMAAKADALREELDAAITRMEQCKDQLITELFEFQAHEAIYAQHITDCVTKELDYHRRCVAHLEKLEPELKHVQENASVLSSYGTSLAEHVGATEREIAMPLESCITCLLDMGLYEEGLFRITGGATKLKKFRALADAGVMDLMTYDAQEDIHAVSGALKQYLRELPDPLLTQRLYKEWLSVASVLDKDKKLQEIWSVIDQLPPENKANLRYLMKFCSVLASKQEYNKMSAGNIALVLAPNLLWAPNDDITANMMVSNSIANIIESMIIYVDYFFGNEQEFIAPSPPPSHKSSNHNRTLSSGSTGEVKIDNHPNNSLQTKSSPTHSRNHSSETILNSHSTDTIRTKKKKHAPPAPVKTSPVLNRKPSNEFQTPPTRPSQPGSNNGTHSHSAKPPIATKRTSVKQRPNMPPPQPPDSQNKNGTVPSSAPALPPGPQPRPRPKPPVRKKTFPVATAIQEGEDSSLHDTQGEFPLPVVSEDGSLPPQNPSEDHMMESPTMPDLPPPPLPSEMDTLDTMTQFQSVESPEPPVTVADDEEDERDFIVTSL